MNMKKGIIGGGQARPQIKSLEVADKQVSDRTRKLPFGKETKLKLKEDFFK